MAYCWNLYRGRRLSYNKVYLYVVTGLPCCWRRAESPVEDTNLAKTMLFGVVTILVVAAL